MKKLSNIVTQFKESIFTTMTALANENNAINLSQGFPDFDGAKWVCDLATEAIMSEKNQSSPAHGTPELRKAISNNYNKYYSINYDQNNNITVTNGATEAIYSTITALVNPGDEVIVFEPFFDTYIPAIELAGGVVIPVTLHTPDFTFNRKKLEESFSDKTKLVIINTPHNPTGKVFSEDELYFIANLVEKHDTYILSDEVYEHLLFDEAKHIPPASIKNMFNRTITISSTGKTFGLTGWRIGWAAAPKELTHAIRMVHQNVTFSAPRPLQEAMAIALNKLDDYIPDFRKTYIEKRDLLLKGLIDAGFSPNTPKSTYFIMCPIPNSDMDDIEFAKYLIKNKKVAVIPPSAFYMHSKDGEKYLRFCFAKRDETLIAAIRNLNSY